MSKLSNSPYAAELFAAIAASHRAAAATQSDPETRAGYQRAAEAAEAIAAQARAEREQEEKPDYRCPQCKWLGSAVSYTDASALDEKGVMQRVHVPVCPDCFAVVRRVFK